MDWNFFKRIAVGTMGGFLMALSAPLYVYAQESGNDTSSAIGVLTVAVAVGIGMMLSIWQQNRKKK